MPGFRYQAICTTSLKYKNIYKKVHDKGRAVEGCLMVLPRRLGKQTLFLSAHLSPDSCTCQFYIYSPPPPRVLINMFVLLSPCLQLNMLKSKTHCPPTQNALPFSASSHSQSCLQSSWFGSLAHPPPRLLHHVWFFTKS